MLKLYIGFSGSDSFARGKAMFRNGELFDLDEEEEGAYRNSMYACDGGLVCFVPQEHKTSCPILVCNPLTSIWRTLPLVPRDDFENKEIVMVQLVAEVDAKCYKVMVVSREKKEGACSAQSYNSRTGVWCVMDSGLVSGTASKLEAGPGIPYVFDCKAKTLFDLRSCASLQSVGALAYAMAKDHLYVLCDLDNYKLFVLEYAWESNGSDLRQVNVTKSSIKDFPEMDKDQYMLFASSSFFLLFSDNYVLEWGVDHHQQIGLCTRSTKEWHIPPPLGDEEIMDSEELKRLNMLIMCELRWDVTP